MRYVLSNLGQGLRRNVSMHLAVVLTLFVSLTLVGFGVLLREQSIKATDQWGSELQITAFLCNDRDDNPACTGEVTQAQKDALAKVIEDNPEVASWRFESKEEAYEKVKASGFYKDKPYLETPILELTNKTPTDNSKGLRYGSLVQIRDIWSEELEAALNGQKSPQAALDAAADRGNQMLRQFERTASR